MPHPLINNLTCIPTNALGTRHCQELTLSETDNVAEAHGLESFRGKGETIDDLSVALCNIYYIDIHTHTVDHVQLINRQDGLLSKNTKALEVCEISVSVVHVLSLFPHRGHLIDLDPTSFYAFGPAKSLAF